MNTPGGNTNATAEHAFALIMSVLRKFLMQMILRIKENGRKKILKGN